MAWRYHAVIITLKKDEIITLIDKLGELETQFWVDYRHYTKDNRKFLEEQFTSINSKLEKLIDDQGIQESFIDEV